MNLVKLISDKLWKIKLNGLIEDQFESKELRAIFAEKYDINVGLYSYGCFVPEKIVKGTTIGRYCSFAPDVCILNRNHGLDFISLHPYLFNSKLGLVESDKLTFNHCTIEDDVWIGQGAIITPSVKRIGRGAIIGAGSIVTKDVQPYSIVAGNPAKLIKFRFTPNTIIEIEKSQWWKLSKEQIGSILKSNANCLIAPEKFIQENIALPNFNNLLND